MKIFMKNADEIHRDWSKGGDGKFHNLSKKGEKGF